VRECVGTINTKSKLETAQRAPRRKKATEDYKWEPLYFKTKRRAFVVRDACRHTPRLHAYRGWCGGRSLGVCQKWGGPVRGPGPPIIGHPGRTLLFGKDSQLTLPTYAASRLSPWYWNSIDADNEVKG